MFAAWLKTLLYSRDTALNEKLSSARVLQLLMKLLFSKFTILSIAKPNSLVSNGFARKPVWLLMTISNKPPILNPTTGVPQLKASVAV